VSDQDVGELPAYGVTEAAHYLLVPRGDFAFVGGRNVVLQRRRPEIL
jgi:hypothetical protein